MMFYWFRQRRKLKRDPVGFIRQEFAFWGCSCDGMSEELERNLLATAQMFGRVGYKSQEFAKAMQLIPR